MTTDVQSEAGPIFLLGGGGYASDVLNVIERAGLLGRVTGFYDDQAECWRMERWGLPHLGGLDARLRDGQFVLAVGMPRVRARVLARVDIGDARPLTVIDPDAKIGHAADIGPGAAIFASAYLSPMVRVGAHCYVGQNTSLGHDAVLGSCCSIMPGATISGDCRLGDEVLIGANAVVIQGIEIGAGAIVGAGAVVTRDVESNTTVVGSPARAVDQRP